jgi:hypothetical protein
MYVATNRLRPASSRSHKIIDAPTHGLIDYCHATIFLGMALLCRKSNPRAAVAALLSSALVLTESLLTDYPLGFAKVISLATHGRIDAALAASSPLIPRIFGFPDTAAAKVFQANSLIAGILIGLTDFTAPAQAKERRRFPAAANVTRPTGRMETSGRR